MSNETKHEFAAAFKLMQKMTTLNLPCPRCGRFSMQRINNPLSRYLDVYVCPDCGTDEAVRDFGKRTPLPLEEWFGYKVQEADFDKVPDPVHTNAGDGYYYLEFDSSCLIQDESIIDIMNRAKNSEYFSQWCLGISSQGDSIEELTIEQLKSETGIVFFCVDENNYTLTLHKFLKGVREYLLNEGIENITSGCLLSCNLVDDECEEILQYALFGSVQY